MVRLSRASGKHLGPFFRTWGVPTSEGVRASIAGQSPWMPPGFQAPRWRFITRP